MTEQNTQLTGSNPLRHRPLRWSVSPWSVGAGVIALLVLMPLMSIVWMALTPEENAWPHLMATTLPRYTVNTLVICLSVGVLSAAIGTGSAWMLTMYRFWGSRAMQWLLLTPLAIPAYVGAYALVDFLEYAGPVQTGLRSLFGWESSQDYWFPQIRSRWAAIVVLTAALNPYVFLLVRTALREQSGDAYEVARALGAGPLARFWRVGLPLARPAIAAGVAIVMMETLSDFGVVDFFAVQTLTTGIFTVWLESHNAGGAAQIALVILGFVFLLAAMEKISRSRSRFYRTSRQSRPVTARHLTGFHAALCLGLCAVPFVIGFVLPVGVLAYHAINKPEFWFSNGLLSALVHTLTVGGAAAAVSVIGALFLVYGVRMSGRQLPRKLMPLTTIGYAAPGAVLGVGILIPMAAADNYFADGVLAVTGWDPGLLMTGTAFAVIYAYCVRFFAIAQGTADAAFERVSPSLPMAARSLGRSAKGALAEVYVPLIRRSVGTALLLVFVDSVKELPATLLLRPFNYGTLATRVYEQASLEQLEQAAPPALMVIAVGLVAVAMLARAGK
ncbi:putative 2-aminoethylphosphonate transport system permease protein PhnU [Aliiroseovarius sp. xm-m-379]|uniref:ABC transporter permease n=1 Tax=Aliiroseovarius TaxID=1658781 RepID=UPI0015687B74|nr:MULTISPECIES: iron ABC transporter permease [Aliiroseovarius]NRP11460.1 putative 2-aminoethylphosphonate transport system permease protein PhnU [Aliiroseovarius sp. xm-d-517]NRP23953.1 putative 2-aminoethylphosphonate transport system permease protein PhnU [Aliiroseovarius sp. xm-m-379]NRP28800.1 putative 2-aminoethylphosphonate transport system permease protein PhnU [Aliiroseovarius sp. xm-m-314]NRP32752.1 putative 2-aminoethylphosphonate transport system permease protein PhnU [Aliiroseovar